MRNVTRFRKRPACGHRQDNTFAAQNALLSIRPQAGRLRERRAE